jgi:hypothetical protein
VQRALRLELVVYLTAYGAFVLPQLLR